MDASEGQVIRPPGRQRHQDDNNTTSPPYDPKAKKNGRQVSESIDFSAEFESNQLRQQREDELRRKRQNLKLLWGLFVRLAKPYWSSVPRSKKDITVVMLLGLLHAAFNVAFSYASRYFMNALNKRDQDRFWSIIVIYSVMLALGVPVVVFYTYMKDLTVMRWREWLTERMLTDYFKNKNYYCIESTADLDNPDQRIAEDIKSFTSTSIHFFMTIFFAVVDLFNFSFILATIYIKLFPILIIYAVGGTIITVLIGRRLISLHFVQLQKEADFRFSLIRVRTNAESIAFYANYREGQEQYDTERFFSSALRNWLALIRWARNLAFWTTVYSYALKVLPYIVVAPLYFARIVELGVVSQSAQAFHHVLDDLSILVRQFEHLSAFSAGIDRLGELEEFLKKNDIEKKRSKLRNKSFGDYETLSMSSFDDGLPYNIEDNNRAGTELLGEEEGTERPKILLEEVSAADAPIVIENLDLYTPDKSRRLLFSSLNMTLEHGKSLLIVGPSGCGKSSLLRALAGLWETGRGRISRPASRHVFFLPQKPYCTLGTLEEQLVYPRKVSVAQKTQRELMDALEVVNLQLLPQRLGGFDSKRDWAAVLSTGEQQRLAFARVIVNEPALCVLDEATSALDIHSERQVYAHLKSTKATYVSVGHRPSLFEFHDFVLRLSFDAKNCQISRITDTAQETAEGGQTG
eukprot:Plantae.Rhodophyta-Hildenbrandia_rubra.ctg4812.p1 GENE.Plantae.Rhodophyta-Hildenbrandia_rubra.ctg4812~~Plantae.Rhodophyta-Hildenbrandia_rubra.ctg4812.p1  ORF type:complete len:690 (+),score=61.53 Plantae.Rhodophyta-Hildenbrandia_rubra.ctg4812:1724-3793(+)